jgi:hypothetical protein
MSAVSQALKLAAELREHEEGTEHRPRCTLTEFVDRCFAQGTISCAPWEDRGQMTGGILVIKGEHEYGVVRAFLQNHCGTAEPALPQLEPTEEGKP